MIEFHYDDGSYVLLADTETWRAPQLAAARASTPRLGAWQRLGAWLHYLPASWPRARLVRR